ncbi:uncharacterized protein PRCAT00004903001 [Priceomyces carsonii]|uniref:uncharacterized protein n=1 Tax=Priceomyces carsonii TaxID=28549 RepID=UPI002ED907A9|nr:unnamed protein product [Priceomyces carsonii]
MSSVPILTIPESAYDASSFSSPVRRRSVILAYIFKLAHGSTLVALLTYVLGYFIIKPLLEIKAKRRLELLEKYRSKIRDYYISLIGKVKYIPIVAINKKDGSGKFYADAVCQTQESYLQDSVPKSKEEQDADLEEKDSLYQQRLLARLAILSKRLETCTSYLISEIPHYKIVDQLVKEFQRKSDVEYFNSGEFLTVEVVEGDKRKKKDLALEAKNEIRSIKGLYMSGKA